MRVGQVSRAGNEHIKRRFKSDGGVVFRSHHGDEVKLVRTVSGVHVAYLTARPKISSQTVSAFKGNKRLVKTR